MLHRLRHIPQHPAILLSRIVQRESEAIRAGGGFHDAPDGAVITSPVRLGALGEACQGK